MATMAPKSPPPWTPVARSSASRWRARKRAGSWHRSTIASPPATSGCSASTPKPRSRGKGTAPARKAPRRARSHWPSSRTTPPCSPGSRAMPEVANNACLHACSTPPASHKGTPSCWTRGSAGSSRSLRSRAWVPTWASPTTASTSREPPRLCSSCSTPQPASARAQPACLPRMPGRSRPWR